MIADRIVDYRVQAAQLWEKLEAHATAGHAAHDAGAELERATAHLTDLRARVSAEQRDAAGAHEYFPNAGIHRGRRGAEVLQTLGLAADALKATHAAQKAVAAERDESIEQRGGAASRQALLGGQLDEVKAQRLDAVESMRHFAATGLLRVALPQLELPDAAEALGPEFHGAAGALDRVGAGIGGPRREGVRPAAGQDQLRAQGIGRCAFPAREFASAQPVRDAIVVIVVFRRITTVPDLAATLDAEVADRSRLLSEREREILENHLVSEVASTLQELIFAAEQQVARIDRGARCSPDLHRDEIAPVLGTRPGCATRHRRAQAPTAPDRRCLERGGSRVGRRVSAERDRTGPRRSRRRTWLEHLTEALDYRRWNRFVIKRQQNGQWRSATGPASGGERVLAASVPLFAAASAHYASAGNPDAPRLVRSTKPSRASTTTPGPSTSACWRHSTWTS